MTKQKRSDAHIVHERYEISPPLGDLDPKTIRSVTVERRGLEDFARRNYHDERIAAVEAIFNHTDNLQVLSDLLRGVEAALKRSGADGWDDVISKVDNILEGESDKSEKTRNSVIDVVVSKWIGGIAQQYGYLSLEYKCANLLRFSNILTRIVGEDEAAIRSIAGLCEAYYWAQLDLTAVHYLAVEGQKARSGRAASPAARRKAGAEGDGILRAVLRTYVGGLEGRPIPKTEAVLFGIRDEVNRQRASAGLKPLTDNSLQQALKAPLAGFRKKTREPQA